jgi:predicted ribosomally synthesized peptide with SipW-like signal peptide
MKLRKIITLVAALVLVAAVAVGGTLAYLSAQTDEVTNVFTVGNVSITLEETTGDNYKMVPGETLDKDPTITVKADSEDCWLFVKVTETDLSDYITYELADGWTALDGVTGVYYRTVTGQSSDQSFSVLKDDQVTVLDTVTGIEEGHSPSLTFQGFAVQSSGITDAATAWAQFEGNAA